VVFCKFMHTSQDREGKLEFYCRHFDRRIDLNLLERCQSCPAYAGS
jgi:hypothetical protein